MVGIYNGKILRLYQYLRLESTGSYPNKVAKLSQLLHPNKPDVIYRTHSSIEFAR